jgi:hypothetical protein
MLRNRGADIERHPYKKVGVQKSREDRQRTTTIWKKVYILRIQESSRGEGLM